MEEKSKDTLICGVCSRRRHGLHTTSDGVDTVYFHTYAYDVMLDNDYAYDDGMFMIVVNTSRSMLIR